MLGAGKKKSGVGNGLKISHGCDGGQQPIDSDVEQMYPALHRKIMSETLETEKVEKEVKEKANAISQPF